MRRRYRVRTYNTAHSAAVFLECKERRGATYSKRKVRLTEDDLLTLRNPEELDSEHFVHPHVLGHLLWRVDRCGYRPASLVVYDREAHVAPGQFDTIRVTFDRNLRARVFPSLSEICSEEDLVPLLYGWTILEVTFTDVVPRFLRSLAAAHALERQACSKYGLSVASFLDGSPITTKG